MSDDFKTPGFQFGLIDLFLGMTAAGIWLTAVIVLRGPIVSPVVILVVLVGITVAVQRLLRDRKHSWPVSAILAPLICAACLAAAAFWASRQ